MIQRASIKSAPAVLNIGDRAVWVTGWNEAVVALEAEQAQIDDLRTQLARRTVERDMAIQMAACGEQAQEVEPVTTNIERIAGAISRHISVPLFQREVLAAAQYIVHRYMPSHVEPTVKQPLSTERAEAIARLFECLRITTLTTREATAIKDAADMLEADVSLINEGNKAQQVAVSAGFVPMTTTQIRKVYALVPYREIESTVNYLDFARAIERYHGIAPQGDNK